MSPLWRKQKIPQYQSTEQNPSPRHTINPLRSVKDKIPYFLSNNSIEGTSLPAFPGRRVKASMTVEASIVLPLFLAFFVNLSCALEIIRLHGNLQIALWEVGNRLSVYGYVLDQDDAASLTDKLAGAAFSHVYIRNEMVKHAGEEYLDTSPMTHGADGLQFLESDIFGNSDTFEVIVTYAVSPWMDLIGFSSFRMANRYYGHIWNGYKIPDGENMREEDRDTVYMTENGEVYHEDRGCRHLKVTVQEVSLGQIGSCRNENGVKYTLCERCNNAKKTEVVYITTEGRRFHYDKECSGLKRTVYSVLRYMARDYPACKRCSAGD